MKTIETIGAVIMIIGLLGVIFGCIKIIIISIKELKIK